MNVLSLVLIALLCGIAAAAAVWTISGIAENAVHLLQRRKTASPSEEAPATSSKKVQPR